MWRRLIFGKESNKYELNLIRNKQYSRYILDSAVQFRFIIYYSKDCSGLCLHVSRL
jgi:hypothetical protein